MSIVKEIACLKEFSDLQAPQWWGLFNRLVSPDLIESVLQDNGAKEERLRKLPAKVIVWLVIGMGLFTEESIPQVFRALIDGIRFMGALGNKLIPKKSAFCQARYRLGSAVMVDLFRRLCKPIATPSTPGAFLFGYRLMGIDGCVEDVPDSPENSIAFGRQKGSRGDSAFPQLRNVHLVELGTHAICDSIVRGYRYDERSAAYRLLRSVDEKMLLLWDCGFHSFKMVRLCVAKNIKLLGRLPQHAVFEPLEVLPDGSFIAEIYASAGDRKARRNGIRVRIIEYTIDDPCRTGHQEKHRLMTTLFDWEEAPAKIVAVEYHQRWEAEITFDEIDTHQRVQAGPMRSQKPEGVVQEAYGILIAHYLVRYFMHEAVISVGIDPDRISFIDSVRVIRRRLDKFQIVSEEHCAGLYREMLVEIAENQLPPRDNRSNPRVVKRKMSTFARKRDKHRRVPQSRKPFPEVVVMLN